MRLSQHQIDQFSELGYLVLPDLFDPDEVSAISQAFDTLRHIAAGLRETTTVNNSLFVMDGPRVQRVVWCSGAAPELERWCTNSRLLQPVFQLLTPPGERPPDHVVQLICQAHLKLPGDDVSFPWHQDAEHRRYGSSEWSDTNARGSYVQTVLAVDEMTEDNGPLVFIPGSSSDGPLPADEVAARAAADNRVALVARPGSVALFGPYTIHGSEPNRSEHPRRAWVNGYAYPGANRRVYPGCGVGVKRRLAGDR